jgi:membrane protein required for colicin V production
MNMFGLNIIDAFIIVVLVYHVVRGYYAGFWALFGRLISFVGGLAIALMSAAYVGEWILDRFDLIPVFAYALGYIIPFVTAQLVISVIINRLFQLIP